MSNIVLIDATNISFGICCIISELKDKKIFCSRKPILKTIEKKGVEYLKEQCLLNCRDLLSHLHWCKENNINVFRISSGLFPHKSNKRAPQYTLDFAKDILKTIGDFAKDNDIRLTFHPGQYNVVGTPHKDAFESTLRD